MQYTVCIYIYMYVHTDFYGVGSFQVMIIPPDGKVPKMGFTQLSSTRRLVLREITIAISMNGTPWVFEKF